MMREFVKQIIESLPVVAPELGHEDKENVYFLIENEEQNIFAEFFVELRAEQKVLFQGDHYSQEEIESTLILEDEPKLESLWINDLELTLDVLTGKEWDAIQREIIKKLDTSNYDKVE